MRKKGRELGERSWWIGQGYRTSLICWNLQGQDTHAPQAVQAGLLSRNACRRGRQSMHDRGTDRGVTK
jgi:hypothetical protein